MKNLDNKNIQFSGCLSNFSGCLVSVLLFPICIFIFGWFAMANSSMTCAYPNKSCSQVEKNIKGVTLMVLLFGGGFGIPIGTGLVVNKAMKKVVRKIPKSNQNN